jgi:tetratricopeptide (TPR) repeat protein/tRNA A-37 threonylcarbamoyl transferase component Bud32
MASSQPLIGHILGHYRIVEHIGAGGMGVVYRAHDEQLDRDVAVKVLPARTLANEVARQRFRREALALAKLNHQNIAAVYEFGSQDGVDFLVMELIRGVTLDIKLTGGALSEPEVVRLGTQIAEGLEAAHEQRIVHRDLKPGNLRITSVGKLKILDFGLAQLMEPENQVALTTKLTLSQGVTGTLPYMAPEQLRGETTDARSDVWAVGVVLYEMATGQRPFDQKIPTALADDIIHKPPLPPRQLRPELSVQLEPIILKCLEKAQANRYQSAQELRSDLERLSTGGAPLAARQRWRWPVLMASGLALLLGATTWSYLIRRQATHARAASVSVRRSVAVLGFKNLSGKSDEAWLATALSEMLNTELAAGEKLRTISGEDVAHTKNDLSLSDTDSLGRDSLARLRKNLGIDYVVLGSYLDLGKEAGGQIRLDLRLQDAIAGETIASVSQTGTEAQLFDLVSRTGERLRERLGVGTVSPVEAVGMRVSLSSNPETMRLYSEGLAKLRVFDSLAARDLLQKAVVADPHFALAHSALAEAWSRVGYDSKAKDEAKKAFDLAAGLSRQDRLLIEGRYREVTSDWAKAVEVYMTLFALFPDNVDYGLHLASAQGSIKPSEAIATLERLRRLPPPAGNDPRIDLLESSVWTGVDFKKAVALAGKAVEKGASVSSQLVVARGYSILCGDLGYVGRSNEAYSACESAREAYASAGDRSGVGRSLNDLAVIYAQQGDLPRAQEIWKKTLANFREIGNVEGVAAAYNNLGEVVLQMGDLSEARSQLGQALPRYREVDDRDGMARVLADLGETFKQMGKLEKAKDAYQQAMATAREIDDNSVSASALHGLGEVLISQADFSAARIVFQSALKLRNAAGEKQTATETQVALAELAMEEGQLAEVETPLRQAEQAFHDEQQTDDEISAAVALAKIMLAGGRVAEAQAKIDSTRTLAEKSHSRAVRLNWGIVAGRVLLAAGKLEDARWELDAVLSEATQAGFVSYQFEARLALGEMVKKSGHVVTARANLASLEKEARAKGFGLIARKAAAALKQT